MFGGYVTLSQALGYLGAAVLGYANGNGDVSHDVTYAILIVLQFVLLLIGIASFSDAPGFWMPELDAPKPEEEVKRLAAQAATAALGAGAQVKSALQATHPLLVIASAILTDCLCLQGRAG